MRKGRVDHPRLSGTLRGKEQDDQVAPEFRRCSWKWETRVWTLASQPHHPKNNHPQGGVGSSKALLVHKGLGVHEKGSLVTPGVGWSR